MTIETKCLAAKNNTGKMINHTIQRRAVGEEDVHIKISYSGICHSDIHTVKDEWGKKQYPLCVGHEIIGKVVAVGDKVTKFKVGDIAGVGCFVDSCRNCDECKDGVEQYCSGPGGMHGTYGSTQPEAKHPGGFTHGGYSSDIVVDQNYTIKVPENLNCAAAAPLLCAGITCYSPFMHYGLKAGMKLGVVGLGGLGHMAVKIAKAMGAEVTVITRSESKKESALKLGAKNVVISTNDKEMEDAAKSLHMIYNSVAFDHDQKPYLNLLKSSGTMIMVGGVPKSFQFSAFHLIPRRLVVGGSCIGGIKETQDMIDFCSKHNIVSDIELIPATPEAVDTAYERTINADVRYRFVIDTAATM
jgi:uncharacterized zinc-type alcohol dehydrogenase-like protein